MLRISGCGRWVHSEQLETPGAPLQHQSQRQPRPLSRRVDIPLFVSAVISYLGIAAFAVSQTDPALHVSSDTQETVIVWLVLAGGTCGICWVLRPSVPHLALVMELALHGDTHPTPLPVKRPRQLAVRRILWGPGGTAGAAAFFILAAASSIDSITRLLGFRGTDLWLTTLVLGSLGAVSAIGRVAGSNLGEVDTVFRAAQRYAEHAMTAPSDARAPQLHRQP